MSIKQEISAVAVIANDISLHIALYHSDTFNPRNARLNDTDVYVLRLKH